MSSFTRVLIVLVALVCTVLFTVTARAYSSVDVVRDWFGRLSHKDWLGALRLTDGNAHIRTREVAESIDRQAAQHNAEVELKVRDLNIEARDSQTVEARFAIDVVGKKWIFSRVARRLSGTAQFRLDPEDRRIVAIDGRLE